MFSAGLSRLHGCDAGKPSKNDTEACDGANCALTRSCSLNDVDGSPDRGVYIQMRGIEQVRVGGGFEGGDRAGLVAFVTAQDIGQDRRLVHRHAVGRQCCHPSMRPTTRRGRSSRSGVTMNG